MEITIYNVVPAICLINEDVEQFFTLNKKDIGREVRLNELSEDKQGSTCICYEIKDGEYKGNILKEFYPQDKRILPYIEREETGKEFLGKCIFTSVSKGNKDIFNQYYDRFINQINSMADVQKVYEDRSLFDALDLHIADTSIGLCILCEKLKDINDFRLQNTNKSEKENILCVQWHPEDFAANGNKSMQGRQDRGSR